MKMVIDMNMPLTYCKVLERKAVLKTASSPICADGYEGTQLMQTVNKFSFYAFCYS